MNIKLRLRLFIAIYTVCVTAGLISACATPSVQDKGNQLGLRTSTNIQNQGSVIEVVTFILKEGVTLEEFRTLDKSVELEHVAKQPGFISRESAAGENGEWVVIVHWRSVEDAEASMASFSSAPAATQFMSKIEVSTMRMKRYLK